MRSIFRGAIRFGAAPAEVLLLAASGWTDEIKTKYERALAVKLDVSSAPAEVTS